MPDVVYPSGWCYHGRPEEQHWPWTVTPTLTQAGLALEPFTGNLSSDNTKAHIPVTPSYPSNTERRGRGGGRTEQLGGVRRAREQHHPGGVAVETMRQYQRLRGMRRLHLCMHHLQRKPSSLKRFRRREGCCGQGGAPGCSSNREGAPRSSIPRACLRRAPCRPRTARAFAVDWTPVARWLCLRAAVLWRVRTREAAA